MLLGFKEQHNGLDTGFVRKILANDRVRPGRDFAYYAPEFEQALEGHCQPKLHTLRGVNHPINAGNTIHFATGVRTKQCRIFGVAPCVSTQLVAMKLAPRTGTLLVAVEQDSRFWHVFDEAELTRFVQNDGFDTLQAFDDWFRPLIEEAGGRLERKLIHWTDLCYSGANPFGRKPV